MSRFSPEEPFHISVPQASLDALQQKLALSSFPDEIDGAEWKFGAPLSDVKRLVEHWRTSYDWRASEKNLNEELPQFKRNIEVTGFGSIGIHYVHKKSEVVDAIPLCFIHGWPGSFIEVRHILPLLINGGPESPSFHVVALSLPNFGFSDGVKKPGFKLQNHAEVAHTLMESLGYNEYVVQGGDWGYGIARYMAYTYGPEHVKAWHTNFPVPPAPSLFQQPLTILGAFLSFVAPVTAQLQRNKALFEHTRKFERSGLGYLTIQSTKPQTLGYSLADSPVGLLAWIYEKLVTWADNYPWTDDQILEWVSIYYFSTSGPAASVRLYYEASEGGSTRSITPGPKPTAVPLGISHFPAELVRLPRGFLDAVGNIVIESEHSSGGHFAAHEKPQELVDDIRNMFKKGGPAFGVVNGRSGYP